MSLSATTTTVRLEISPLQLRRLLKQRQLVASDFRCCDHDSQCIIRQLLLECTAEHVIELPND